MGSAVRAQGRQRLARVALPTFAILYGMATIAVAAGVRVPTIYAQTSTTAAAADFAAGLGLIAAGMSASLARPVPSTASLATLLGVVWLAPIWVGWEGGSALARSLGMVATPFLLPLLLNLVLAFPGGRVVGPRERLTVAIVYGSAVVVSLGRAFFRDPFLDLQCWNNCTDNLFLVLANQELVGVLDSFSLYSSIVIGMMLVAICLWRVLSATRPGRAALSSVLLPAALAAAVATAYAILLLRDPHEVPEDSVFRVVFYARALTLVGLAAGLTWTVIRSVWMRNSISRLATDLGHAPQPGSLQSALAESLGDEDVQVSYWLPGSRRYVDAVGRVVEPRAEGGFATTAIVRGGEPVALVLHDQILSAGRNLEREIGAAARLAVDNERLRAEVLAHLEDLLASRARIVDKSDAARRLLERNLHDGAQQRLLALSYALRMARAAAEADGDTNAASVLDEATHEAQATLKELRELAHGIYPAILTEAGLGPALATLVDEAPLAVEIDHASEARYPDQIEAAAYFVVAEAIADAVHRGASYVTVSALQDEGRLVVEFDDDGSERSSTMLHVADRVGALGGHLDVGPRKLRGEIPCA